MKGLKHLLVQEENRLEQIISITSKRLKDAPEGSIQCSNYHGHERYYRYIDNKPPKYLHRSETELINLLSQKSYDKRVLRTAQKRLSQIRKLLKGYDDSEIEHIYLSENQLKRSHIQPVEPLWEEQLQGWLNTPYQGKGFSEETPVIFSEKGERVRSKSEKILADYFYNHGINYKYECPLYLNNFGTIYPDFTFLSPVSGREIYWEHEGLMDDPQYAQNNVKKIYTYEKNGIYPGENLILTFETKQTILSTAIIENMVKKYLLPNE